MRLALLLVLISSIAHADPKVAMIEKDLFEEKGGIARLLAAHDQLAQDRPNFRIVEKTPGGRPDWDLPNCRPPIAEDWKTACEKFRKADASSREAEAWKIHEAEVIGPIEADIEKAIAAYAKSRGIELVLEKTSVVYMAPGVDITAAFIKDFNAKHPVVKPKPPKR